MKAGDLRYHQIDIQSPVLSKDSDGNDIQEWETVFANVPARNVPASVNQLLAAKAINAVLKGRFVIRARPGLYDNQRVVSKGVVYDILGWMPDPESGLEYVTAAYVSRTNEGGF